MSTNDNSTDYGPLTLLIGNWLGSKGIDLSPEPSGKQETPYSETLSFEAAGNVTNAKQQTLAVLRYHQVISNQSTGEIFHDQTGYWMWDKDRDTVMHSIAIPRGVCVLAGGRGSTHSSGTTIIEVSATADSTEWGIVQSPFMQDNAKTTAFQYSLKVSGDELSYAETTVLDIYGKLFDHTDSNNLQRSR